MERPNEFTAFIIGLGQRARAHLTVLQQLDEIENIGGFDINAASCNHLATEEIIIYPDLIEGIHSIKPDLVVIATPPDTHLQLVKEILVCHTPRWLLVEKPLTLDLTEAEELIQCIDKVGCRLIVGHQLPYTPEFSALLKWHRDGLLGDIQHIHASCFGSLYDQGSHLIDVVGRLIGLPMKWEWAEATCVNDLIGIRDIINIPIDYHIDESHHGVARFSGQLRMAEGQSLYIECGLLTPQPKPDLGPWLQKRLVVEGTSGIAEAHVASHAILRCGKTERYIESNVLCYENALAAFYRTFISCTDHKDNEHDLGTCQRLAALTEAAVKKQPVHVRTQPSSKLTSPPAKIPLSIIMPMGDHRGYGLQAVASWTQAQHCNPQHFELIVLTDSQTAELVDSINELLRSHDLLIHKDVSDEMIHYDLGAKAANGENLFFTEPHVIAEPEAVTEILAFFTRGEGDGLCGRTTSASYSSIGHLEAQMYDEGFQQWSKPEHFAKVFIRAVGMRRDVYFNVGGFKTRYSRFAEWLLAAELKHQGYQLLYAPGVGVTHIYSDSFKGLTQAIKEFTEGECQFRLDNIDSTFCQEYFGDPAEWHNAMNHNNDDKRNSILAHFILIFRSNLLLRQRLRLLRQLLKHPTFIIFDKTRISAWQFRMSALYSRLLAAQPWLPHSVRYRHFCKFWENTTSFYRVHYALEHSNKRKPQTVNEKNEFSPLPDPALSDVYSPEGYKDINFCWTQPLFSLRLSPSDHPQTLKLKLLPIREELILQLSQFWLNRHFLQHQIVHDDEQLQLYINLPARPSEQLLYGFCPEWDEAKQTGDSRSLGLPLIGFKLQSHHG